MADRLRHFIDLRGENQANTCTNKLHKIIQRLKLDQLVQKVSVCSTDNQQNMLYFAYFK